MGNVHLNMPRLRQACVLTGLMYKIKIALYIIILFAKSSPRLCPHRLDVQLIFIVFNQMTTSLRHASGNFHIRKYKILIATLTHQAGGGTGLMMYNLKAN